MKRYSLTCKIGSELAIAGRVFAEAYKGFRNVGRLILHVSSTTAEHPMARKRSFASIEQLPSKRWRVRYTGPDGAIHKGPNTL
jgi:hypothetical protein